MTAPSHIRLVESQARLAGAVRILGYVRDGHMPEDVGMKAARDLIAQSEEWMAASDDEVRGVVGSGEGM